MFCKLLMAGAVVITGDVLYHEGMGFYRNEDFKNALAELQVIDGKKLEELYLACEKDHTMLHEVLIQKELISSDNATRLLSEILKMPYKKLSEHVIQKEILQILPDTVAKKNHTIVFDQTPERVKIAISRPDKKEIAHFIAKKTGKPVEVYLASDEDIQAALGMYKEEIDKTFSTLLQKKVAGGVTESVSITKVYATIIEDAGTNKASDIHIQPQDDFSVIRFRVDGVMHDVAKLPIHLHSQLINKIKVAAKLRTDEHMAAQDGKISYSQGDEPIDIRVSIVPSVKGENAVLRLLSSRSRRFSLDEIGMRPADIETIKSYLHRPYGMILTTGPTGSGKTTTIYSLVKIINVREKHIATIEEPVEYDIAGITQIQVNQKTNLTFANGLRSILRQDPDIIFVGEIRDEETAGIAVNSALTGHLVLSTLHTNVAATTLPRLIDLGVEPFLVASTIHLIIGQRLVRKICNKCRYSRELLYKDKHWHIDGQPMTQLDGMHDRMKHVFDPKVEHRVYAGKGCPLCLDTGYVGRIGIFELMEISQSIRDLIVAKADANEIEAQAIREGMTTMLLDGLEKAKNGMTTLDEVIRVIKE